MRLAAIDIGSNAARLLINEVVKNDNGQPEFTKLNLLRVPLRLGMDVFKIGEIGPEREKMVIQSMKVFRDLMEIYNVEHYRACATSAMRDAKNGQHIIDMVKKEANINIEIISGDEEATLIYENHVADNMDNDFGYLYIDVGGGSTELTYYENKKLKYKKSFNIGTIRILNNLVKEESWEEMRSEIKTKVIGKKPVVAIGSGGNINKIFSMSKTKDGKPMSAHLLKTFYKEAAPLSVAERMIKYNVREDRADVMVPALEIFNKIMAWGEIKHIYVPKISVADGLIHALYTKVQKKR
ncbi:exopolyphosphatase [Elizabethkingia meningoseptica]|uniref:Ppx/GppA phosphatase family protein n=1 Tax=Elizabethkingia meningoseptica TaxID=238 RepID=UPI0020111D2E|nr:exopolyphosphatase [Elizabethkingia meningoseptica]MCL1674144.1 exopolyphosphatase [Elizabethkingia meningoseptica]MCL1685215.1 exopolyphosphatase [Elizabethkingia meningoseptica]